MSDKPYADLVRSLHPRHLALRAFWNLAWASYRGGQAYLTAENLFSHRLENSEDFARRLQRAYFLNYCQPVVDTYTAYLFRQPPEVLPAEPVSDLVANADRMGNGIVSLMKRAATLSSIFGFVLLGVDRPRAAGEFRTRAEELAAGLNDYLVLICPPDVINWACGPDGRVQWALVCERENDPVLSGYQINSEPRERLRLWTAEKWTDIGLKGEILAEGGNPFGQAPFVAVKHRDVEPGLIGESLLANIALVNREIFNLTSELQEILARQTFSQLVAEGSAEEYGEAGDIKKLGTSSIFLYPEGRKAPQYISPDASQARLLVEQIDRMIDEIYRLASLTRGTVREASAQSGISKAYDFLDTNQALADKAGNLAAGFEAILNLARPDWKGRIRFPRDFGVDDPSELAANIERAIGLGVGPKFRAQLLAKLARTMLAELPEEQRAEVERESQDNSANPSPVTA